MALFSSNHYWARNLPIRYAIAFLFAYSCFFLSVRVWIEEAKKDPDQQMPLPDLSDTQFMGSGYGQGCFIAIALIIIGFILGDFFLASGGAPLFLEAAFDAAFAGVVLRRPIVGDIVMGNWKIKLLENTWKRALLSFLVMIGLATWIHFKVPQATTIAEAVLLHTSHLTDQGCITTAQYCGW